jgi:hypothetical protein
VDEPVAVVLGGVNKSFWGECDARASSYEVFSACIWGGGFCAGFCSLGTQQCACGGLERTSLAVTGLPSRVK